MFLSIFINNYNYLDKLMKTLSSIKNQTIDDYEIILIDDSGYQSKSSTLKFMSDNFYNFNKKIKVLTSLKNQGFSYQMNIAITCAEGEYFIILDEGEKLYPNAVEKLKNNILKYQTASTKIDIVEFKLYYPHHKNSSDIHNKFNILLSPKINKEVLAYTHSLIFTKVFSRNFIINYNIEFINFVRNDTLFIYKSLAYANGFLTINEIIADYDLVVLNYSVFDLLKQWVHIFNFYRELGLYREYYNELEYIFIRFCLITFLYVVRLQNNKKLKIKGIISVENKIKRRLRNFKTNKYLKSTEDIKFKDIIKDINGYIKKWKATYAK